MASCPTCNKDVDPLRAPSARIVGGRVVTYCSTACAGAAADAGAIAAKARIAEATKSEPASVPSTAAASALAAIKQTGRLRDATPVPARQAKATMPVSSEEILAEEDVPPAREKRARTAPPVPPPARPRRRGLVLMFMVVIIIGGMAIAIVQAVSPSSPGPAEARAVPDSRAIEVAPPPPLVDPGKAARTSAENALRELVGSESARVRRVAAAALARTGDAASIAALVELLAAETSEITRLDIAYALARAGDARGSEALAAGLKSSRRDVRADAARLLILLGDAGGAGAKELGRFLDKRSQRLGAAEALARIEDKEAMQVLDEIYLDETAPPDDKIRATIALGRARRGAVKDELVGLLGDGRFNAFAAIALADLRDTTGRDVLVKQLSVSSLRVGAALALRRLDPALDVAPLMPALTDAIAADKDVARVTAAEAILILTGPPELAKYD